MIPFQYPFDTSQLRYHKLRSQIVILIMFKNINRNDQFKLITEALDFHHSSKMKVVKELFSGLDKKSSRKYTQAVIDKLSSKKFLPPLDQINESSFSTHQVFELDSEKKKEILIAQIVAKSANFDLNEQIMMENNREFDFYDEDFEEEIQNFVCDKLDYLSGTLEKYLEYKLMKLDKNTTVEDVKQDIHCYGCMLYLMSSQFRLMPIFTCPIAKLDELSTADSTKTIFISLIVKKYRVYLKKMIEEDEIMKILFDLLRHPSFPTSRFNNKKKIIFLQLFAEAIFFKKKRTNKRRNKKKSKDNADQQVSDSEQEADIQQGKQEHGDLEQEASKPKENAVYDKEFYEINSKVERLGENTLKFPIELSQKFMSTMFLDLKKLTQQ